MVAPSGEGCHTLHAPGACDGDGRCRLRQHPRHLHACRLSKEIGAIREVFGDKIPHIQSTKSLTGHSLGAAGVQESIYGLLMMQERFIGESAHIETLDPEFDGVPIVRKRIDDAKIDTVLSNSFGFGGTQRHARLPAL